MIGRVGRRLFGRRPETPQWDRLAAERVVSVDVGTYGQYHILVHEFRAPDGAWMEGRLRIGRYCSIAPCEIFLGGNHRTEWVSQYPFATRLGLPGAERETSSRGDVMIGNDVWLGHGCTIMSGVEIGHGAVIAARAVVTKAVRPYAIAAGNPAREIRRRFNDTTVDRLLELGWWDWPEHRIRAEILRLTSPPIS